MPAAPNQPRLIPMIQDEYPAFMGLNEALFMFCVSSEFPGLGDRLLCIAALDKVTMAAKRILAGRELMRGMHRLFVSNAALDAIEVSFYSQAIDTDERDKSAGYYDFDVIVTGAATVGNADAGHARVNAEVFLVSEGFSPEVLRILMDVGPTENGKLNVNMRRDQLPADSSPEAETAAFLKVLPQFHQQVMEAFPPSDAYVPPQARPRAA